MTQPPRRGLGRGLDALIPQNQRAATPPAPPGDTPASSETGAPAAPASPAQPAGPQQLDLDLISPNPEQPRTHFEPEQLRELADSIREHGILQPLVVTRDPQGGYRLIAGERRLQAARLAGLKTVPVVMRTPGDNRELLELALIENIQRADLNAIEEALAYKRLIDEHDLTQEEAARRVGKGRVAVANALRLLQLESEIRRSLVAGEISEGHARALLQFPEGRDRLNAWREIVKRRMSVRETEALARKSSSPKPGAGSNGGSGRRDPNIADIEDRLQRALSTRVTVTPQKQGARITIECFSADEFDNVVQQILGDDE